MKSRTSIRASRGEKGYALLLAAFIGTLMLITVMMAAPNIRTIRKRELEKEMIWRGNQYVRGIKMYYRKTGKFPTSLEDLTRPQAANIRFMRQSYKDPMNAEDGSWRLLYVGPNGQLMGSLKPQPPTILQPTGIPGTANIGGPASNINAATLGGPLVQPPGGVGPQGAGAQGSGQNSGQGAVSTDTDANGLPIGAQATQPTTIFGGNIIGVGSKAFGKSVIVYDKAPNYRLFEFYWDPSKDTIQVGGQQNIPGASTPGAPAGAQPGTPGTNPAAPSPNPLGGNPQDPSGPPTQVNPPPQ